ncbi:perlucin-like protein [Dreissena polymorpha]|nr:perlucin-like protein [Dreissena polymorpha]
MIGNSSLYENATRTLNCSTGYSPRNTTNVVSKCANGQWTKITECVKDCPSFITPKNGTVEGDSLKVGSTRNLTCVEQNGYQLLNSSDKTSVCDNGTWSAMTICVPAQCNKPQNKVQKTSKWNNSQYLFHSQKETITNAEDICKICGGHVIIIDDENEQNWTVSELRPFATGEDYSVWLGIENDAGNRTYRKHEHDKTELSYTYWDKGQPNIETEKCVIFGKLQEWRWSDVGCSQLVKHFVICELHI